MNPINKKIFIVRGMDCASCALTIEKALKGLPELSSANVNYATEKAVIESNAYIDSQKIQSFVKEKTGYELVEEQQKSEPGVHEMAGMQMSGDMGGHDHAKMLKEKDIRALWRKFVIGAVLSVAIIILNLPDYFPFISDFL